MNHVEAIRRICQNGRMASEYEEMVQPKPSEGAGRRLVRFAALFRL
jgi:hypothetical protein